MPRRYAPRGPRIAPAVGVEVDGTKATCRAHKRSGAQCGNPPMSGGMVCRMHGGSAPQVKRKAAERLLDMQSPALARLLELIQQTEFPSTAYQAVRDVLDRTMGRPQESVELQHTGHGGGPVQVVISHDDSNL